MILRIRFLQLETFVVFIADCLPNTRLICQRNHVKTKIYMLDNHLFKSLSQTIQDMFFTIPTLYVFKPLREIRNA